MADEINLEADRVLRIWAESKRNERGTVTQGYPKRSAGIECGGSCGEETFDLMVAKEDSKTAHVADVILDDMAKINQRHYLAIWNHYVADVYAMRDASKILIDACMEFLTRWKRRGICF